MEQFDSERLLAFYHRMGFRDLKRRVRSRIDHIQKKTPVSSTTDRYSSILEGGNSRNAASSKRPLAGGNRSHTKYSGDKQTGQFANKMVYKAPPAPSEFDDVPF